MAIQKLMCLLLLLLPLQLPVSAQDNMWRAEDGQVVFNSDAPLELITAESKVLRGIIDPPNRSFAFSIRMNSFEGFNSEIQQTHFLENYLEEKKYPQATFQGKFIEDIPFDTPGVYSVRAKGILTIHGISKERIIRGSLTIRNNAALLESTFVVPLSDHGITIPKIVMQKIAEEIDVTMEINFSWNIKG